MTGGLLHRSVNRPLKEFLIKVLLQAPAQYTLVNLYDIVTKLVSIESYNYTRQNLEPQVDTWNLVHILNYRTNCVYIGHFFFNLSNEEFLNMDRHHVSVLIIE